MATINERIRAAFRSKPHLKKVVVARALGVTPQRLQGWATQNAPPAEFLGRLADELQVNLDWLIDESAPMNKSASERPVYRGAIRAIPVYSPISAGAPRSNAGDIVEWLELKDWGTEFERWGRIVSGYSMEPWLLDRDVAIFEDRAWEPSQVVHAYSDGEDTVKQVQKLNGELMLCPTNPDYDAFLATGWKVKGVCIGYYRIESDGSRTLREYPSGMRPR